MPQWHDWWPSSGAFAAVRFPHVPWAIEGLVSGAGWTCLYAGSGTGKSILAWQIAESLTLGTPLLDFPRPERKWRVAYIQVDEPQAEWQGQLKAMNAPDIPVLFPKDPGQFPLSREYARRELKAALVRERVEFSIWDSLYKLADDIILNEDPSVGRFLARMYEVTSGQPYLLLHHDRKPKPGQETQDEARDAARGSALLVANSSVAIHMVDKHTLMLAKARFYATDVAMIYGRDFGKGATGRWTLAPSRPASPSRPAKSLPQSHPSVIGSPIVGMPKGERLHG